MLEKDIIENTNFVFNPCLEFACAFNLISRLEEMMKLSQDLNYEPPKEDIQLYEEMHNSLTKYMKSEIEYFNKVCPIAGILAAYCADFEELKDVKSLLDFIEKSNDVIFSII
ncbi:hypothetical protein PL321_18875 [Caloramator sp. mosi_1]|uniref:hypothetical protein n=1 Tax=Caloramator sp. mosi_1 TaxID=3023090 RepID=UPI00235DE961|nr:hypothetical protein [Caloramator sp. mosi_1]WDC84249.1 hypothetical protein PL321_18875 [Caloramator sp. mosi_1]